MSKIDFGIIKNYDEKCDYSDVVDEFLDWADVLEVFNCISIDDKHFNSLSKKMKNIQTLTCEHKMYQGISECGITIIPPESLEKCILNIRNIKGINEVMNLFSIAQKNNDFIICFT